MKTRQQFWLWGVLLLVGMHVYAGQFQLAPMNPEFQLMLEGKSPGAEQENYGYVPSPVDWSHLVPQVSTKSLPERFDLREGNRMTPVRNQSTCGACWAFAACGSMEGWLKINAAEVWDFSENHMKNNHGFAFGHCFGGNNEIVTAYLARQIGPLAESDDPYNPTMVVPPNPGAQIRKRMKAAPIFVSQNQILSEIKSAIMNYGPLSTMMTYFQSNYNNTTKTYYYGGPESPNHMVLLAGWDDTKVVPGAPGAGAWICKNSWGSWWGEGGYFYISYYDTVAAKRGVGFFSLVAPETFSRVYQYDPLGMTFMAGSPPSTYAYAANVFTAEANEDLIAVGTYAVATNTAYEITVYRSGISGDRFLNPACSMSGTLTHAGYYVIDLPLNVPLQAGQQFSIVVRYQTPGWYFPVPIEGPIAGYANATSALGQSYLSEDGISFQDIWYAGDENEYDNTNVCIKAITGVRQNAPNLPEVRIMGRPRIEEGKMVILTAYTANMTGTVTYEWYKDDQIIPNANGSQYTILQVDMSHAGVYILKVTDESKGVYQSPPFVLEVLPDGSMPASESRMIIVLALLLTLLTISAIRRRITSYER